jgi:hypothetical protein
MSQKKVMADIIRRKNLTRLYIRSYVRLQAVFINKAGQTNLKADKRDEKNIPTK